jgi:flagellar motility protein MotE (MotC chaperone)
MFRGCGSLSAVLVLLAAVACAQAQDAAPALPGGPLDLRPSAKPARIVKPAPAKPAKKVAAKVKPKGATTPLVAKVHEPQAVEHAAALPTGTIKPPASPEKTPEKAVVADAPKPVSETRPPFDEYVLTQFCTSLSTAASDGRLAWQAKRLEEIEGRLRDRIAELDAKRAETAEWLKRREEALRKADEVVVAIYSKMKPDAAAAQFSAMDESGAAAILSKLNPRQAGIVLNEIDASRAARIAAEMAGVGQRREVARSVAP